MTETDGGGLRVVMSVKFNELLKVWEANVEFESGRVTTIYGKSFKYIVNRISEELEERMLADVEPL